MQGLWNILVNSVNTSYGAEGPLLGLDEEKYICNFIHFLTIYYSSLTLQFEVNAANAKCSEGK